MQFPVSVTRAYILHSPLFFQFVSRSAEMRKWVNKIPGGIQVVVSKNWPTWSQPNEHNNPKIISLTSKTDNHECDEPIDAMRRTQ